MPHYDSHPPQPNHEDESGRELRGLALLIGSMACSALATVPASHAVWDAVIWLLLGVIFGLYGIWTLVKVRLTDFLAFCCFRVANIGLGLIIGDQQNEASDFALWEEEFQND